MKKLFTLLTLALLSIGTAWADAVTIGLTQANDNTEVIVSGTTYKGTLAAAAYSGTTNLTVAEAHGAGCGINQGERKTTGSDGDYWAAKCFRKTVNSSTWDNTEWVGYSMVVASGYKVSLTNVRATLWDANSNATYNWKVVIENGSGTALYTSGNKTSSTSSIGVLEVVSPTGVSNLTAGTYYVKLYLYQSGSNKYFTVPYLTVDATVEEDNSTTYTVTTSAGAGGTVSPDGEQSVVEKDNIIITATPNTGYAFSSWTVDDVENASTTNPYTFSNVTANHTIAAVFKQLYSVSYNVADENKGTTTKVLSKEYANASDKWTAPTNYYTYSDDKTLTKWNDGVNDYTPGTEYTLAGNITIAPVFTANAKYLDELTAETTISWPFATNNGAPTLNSEGNTQYYVQQTTIAGNKVDVPIFVNTTQDYGISGRRGKFVSAATNCQVNAGTVFKIPAIQGMVIKYMTSSTTAVGNIGFTDDTDNLGGDGSTLTNPTDISSDNKTISYTYTGTADYLYLVDIAGGKYPTGISVTYPQTTIAATISEYGKSTFSSSHPVDIANATPAGLKAYKATAATASSVHMVEVTEAVAGMTGSNKTGLVLVGTPNTTYYIPIAASGTEPSGNLLFGWNSSWGNIGAADSGTNFVLSVQNDEVVWAPVKSDVAPISEGQAALWANVTTNQSRSLRMTFGDNSVTGISEVAKVAEKEGKFFEDGKLVIVKNGKKFNAKGQLVK